MRVRVTLIQISFVRHWWAESDAAIAESLGVGVELVRLIRAEIEGVGHGRHPDDKRSSARKAGTDR